MTDLSRIEAAIADIDWHGNTSAQYLAKHYQTILEALRFQKAALGEPTHEMCEEGYSDNDGERLTSPREIFKAMIAELAKQVKENEDE